jgi:CheY-like chemotaxis protein
MAKILVVDDDHEIQLLYQRLFNKEHTLVPAENGLAGINSLDPSIELVILNFAMPSYNGRYFLEVLQTLPKSYHSIPIISVSAEDEAFVRKCYVDLTIKPSAYVERPNDISELPILFDKYLHQY